MSENKPENKAEQSKTPKIRSQFMLILLEAGNVVLSLAIICLAGLGIFLNRPSVDLAFVKPHYEHWFSQVFDGKTVQIEDYSARWIQKRRMIEVRAHGIHIRSKNGGEQIIDDVRGEFRIKDNLWAMPEIVRLNITGGALTIIRGEDKRIQVSLGTSQRSGNIGALWQSESRTSGGNLLGQIEQINVNSANIYFEDRLDDLKLAFSNLDGSFSFKGGENTLDAVGVLDTDAGVATDFILHLQATPDLQTLNAELVVNNLVPTQIAPVRGPVSILSKLDAPLDLTAKIIFVQDGGIQDLQVKLIAGEGWLKTGTTYKPFTHARINAHYDQDAKNIQIQALEIKSEALDIRADGSVQNPLGEMGGVTDLLSKPINFVLNIASARLNPGRKFDGPLSIKGSQLAGAVNWKTHSIKFDTVVLDFGTFQTDLSASLERDNSGVITAIRADGVIDGIMSREQLLGFWPHEFALGARDWIKNSLKTGQISNLKLQANLDAVDIKNQIIANDHLNLRYDVKNADVQYMRKMPLMRGASGYGVLQGNSSTFYVTGGRVGGLMVDKGQVNIPKLLPYGGDFTIDLNGVGTISEMLRVSNFPPFEFSKNYGVDPKAFGGSGMIDLHITRPLLKHFDQKRILYELSGDFTGVNIPVSIGGFSLNGGQVKLRADKDGISVSGPIKLGQWQATLDWYKSLNTRNTVAKHTLVGTITRDDLDRFGIGLHKYFDGKIGLHISGESNGLSVQQVDIFASFTDADVNIRNLWHKPKGTAGKLSGHLVLLPDGGGRIENLDILADGLDIRGSVALAENFRLIALDLPTVKINDLMDTSVLAKPTDAGVLSISLDGAYLNIEQWVNQADKIQSSSVTIPINLSARLDKISLDANYILTNAQAEFSHTGKDVSHALLRGAIKDGVFLAEIKGSSSGEYRTVRVGIPDASIAMLALLGLNNIEGGKLEINGKLPPSGVDGGLSGQVALDDFTLKQAPVFAQILSLSSLQGMMGTLSGGGLKFNKLEMQFALEDSVLKIREGRVSGPALGLTVEGDIGIATKTVDFDGVLVPSYTVNSILGGIPLLGDIIVGKKGEGMFALNYSFKGPFAKIQIMVNPLSALTPGFLRRMFDIKRYNITDQKTVDLVKKQEKKVK